MKSSKKTVRKLHDYRSNETDDKIVRLFIKLTNREALTVLCSVIKHAESG